MSDTLMAKDLRFTEKEIKKATEMVPSDYIAVKLSSVGKLGAPSIVHVRDYTFEEAMALSEISENNETEVIIQIINSVMFEDVDAGKLHKNDILEILMTIQWAWYSPKLEDVSYYLDDTLKGDDLNDKKNIGKVDIPLKKIETKPLGKDVALPISIAYRGHTVKFCLPKVENEVIAFKLVESKYAQEENELFEIKKKIDNETYTKTEFSKYEKYLKNRAEDFLKINQALLIEEYDGEQLDTLEKKLAVLPKLSLSLLKKYTDVINKYFTFGIEPNITFYSEPLQKEVTRRFDFRTFHFLSSMEQADDSGFDVSFG